MIIQIICSKIFFKAWISVKFPIKIRFGIDIIPAKGKKLINDCAHDGKNARGIRDPLKNSIIEAFRRYNPKLAPVKNVNCAMIKSNVS